MKNYMIVIGTLLVLLIAGGLRLFFVGLAPWELACLILVLAVSVYLSYRDRS